MRFVAEADREHPWLWVVACVLVAVVSATATWLLLRPAPPPERPPGLQGPITTLYGR
jgi:hypothetical protein